MTDRILRRPAVEEKSGYSRSTIYEEMSKGNFPRPVKIGARAVGWLESEICEWIEARKAARELALAMPEKRTANSRRTSDVGQ